MCAAIESRKISLNPTRLNYKGLIVGTFNKGEVDGNTLLAIASGASAEREEA